MNTKRIRKGLAVCGLALVGTMLLLLIALMVAGGHMIKTAVNTAGPALLGVPVTLADAEFRPLRGLLRLEGLHVGNPEGFTSPGLFDLDRMEIRLRPGSLFSDTIRVTRIEIAAPVITYELGLGRSNIGALIEQLGGEPAGEETPGGAGEPEKEGEEPKGKKVVIDELVIRGARVKVSAVATGGLGAPIPLPPITLRDIGKDSGGATPIEVIRDVFTAIGHSVTSVVTGAGKLVGDGVDAVGDAGKKAVDGLKDAGGAVLDALRGGKDGKAD